MQFVGQTGRELPERGKLVGAEDLPIRRVELFNHRVHLGRDRFEHLRQVFHGWIVADAHRSDDLVQPSSHVTQRDGQLVDRALNARASPKPAIKPADAPQTPSSASANTRRPAISSLS